MFENLTDKLTGIFNRLSSKGRLTEKDIDDALAQVRRSLLEADVNFRVARDFIARVKERSMTAEVLESLTPGQQVVKIVHEELTEILSGGEHRLTPASQLPSVLMLVGLQGSGKTTTAAKLALQLRRQGHSSMLVAADLKRPAAISQLANPGQAVGRARLLGRTAGRPPCRRWSEKRGGKGAAAGPDLGHHRHRRPAPR